MAPPTAENMFAQLGRKRRIHPAEEVTTVETTQLKVLEAMDETSDIANSKNSFLPKEAYTEKSSQIFPQGPELAERQLCVATDLVGDYHANNDETGLRSPHTDKDEDVLRVDGRDQEEMSHLSLEHDIHHGGRQLAAPPQALAVDQPLITSGTDATGGLKRRRERKALAKAQRKLKRLRLKLERERKAMIEELAVIDAAINAAMDGIVETTGKSHEWWSRKLR